MESEKLLVILLKEKKILSELKSISNNKQVSLVDNDRSKLEVCIKAEERMLPQIQIIEKERLTAIDEFYSEHGKLKKDYHLESLIENFEDILSEEFIESLKSIHAELKELVADLMKLNKQNIYLINHSRQYLNETMAAIINSSENSILDKKV